MKFSTVAAVASASLAFANPISRRQERGPTDADILNYALTLEHIEAAFYKQGLANFTVEQFAAAGYDSAFYSNLATIAADEAEHVEFLTAALSAAGATPVKECTYAFGVTDVKSFLATASLLEGQSSNILVMSASAKFLQASACRRTLVWPPTSCPKPTSRPPAPS